MSRLVQPRSITHSLLLSATHLLLSLAASPTRYLTSCLTQICLMAHPLAASLLSASIVFASLTHSLLAASLTHSSPVVVEPEQLREQQHQHHDDTEEDVAAESRGAVTRVLTVQLRSTRLCSYSCDAEMQHTCAHTQCQSQSSQLRRKGVSHAVILSLSSPSATACSSQQSSHNSMLPSGPSSKGKRKNGCRVKFDRVC